MYAVCIKNLKARYFEYAYLCGTMCIKDVWARGIANAGVWGEKRPDKRFCFWNRHFDWHGDRRPQIAMNDLVMYKLHVRGFTVPMVVLNTPFRTSEYFSCEFCGAQKCLSGNNPWRTLKSEYSLFVMSVPFRIWPVSVR